MIPSDTNVVLLANDSPNSPNEIEEGEAINWTMYTLKYPSIDTIYQDFKDFADKSLKRYPSFYINLLEEMHLMIKAHIMLGEFQPEENSESGNEMKLVWNNCEELFKESSLAVADFFVLSNPCEHKQSLIFYEMANLNIIGIFQRFLDQNGIIFSPLGLIEVLKTSFYNVTLTHDNQKFDEIFSSTISYPIDENNVKVLKFGEAIIELFSRFAPKEIAKLTLESCGVFREYMDEKIYEFLINYDDKSNEEMLCIILHLLKKDEVSASNSLLDQIKREDLYQLLVRHWNILFEFSTHGVASSTKKLSKSIISFSDFTELLFLTNSSFERCELLTDVLLYHIYDTKMIKFNGNMKLFMEYLASQLGHDSYLNGQNILKMLLEKYLLRYYDTRTQDEMSLLSTTSTTVSSSVSEEPQKQVQKNERKHSFLSWNNDDDIHIGSHHKHAMRILMRVYLSQLKSMSLRQEKRAGQDTRINKAQLFKVINEMSTSLFINQKSVTKFDKIAQLLIQHSGSNPILFLDERYRYLDWFPPFESILQLLSNTDAYENQYDYTKIDKDLLLTLIKLQAILCSGEVSSDIAKEILSYLESNRELIGHDSIMICLLPLNQAVDLIIKNNPQCILEYARCHFKFDNDWSNLIKILQKQANEFEVCEANMGQILFYQRLLKETLEFLASTKSLDVVLKIFPSDKHLINNEVFETIDSKLNNEFEDYVKICVDRERSDKIKKMVEQTGMQLYDAITK
jgi:hypothetical protein